MNVTHSTTRSGRSQRPPAIIHRMIDESTLPPQAADDLHRLASDYVENSLNQSMRLSAARSRSSFVGGSTCSVTQVQPRPWLASHRALSDRQFSPSSTTNGDGARAVEGDGDALNDTTNVDAEEDANLLVMLAQRLRQADQRRFERGTQKPTPYIASHYVTSNRPLQRRCPPLPITPKEADFIQRYAAELKQRPLKTQTSPPAECVEAFRAGFQTLRGRPPTEGEIRAASASRFVRDRDGRVGTSAVQVKPCHVAVAPFHSGHYYLKGREKRHHHPTIIHPIES